MGAVTSTRTPSAGRGSTDMRWLVLPITIRKSAHRRRRSLPGWSCRSRQRTASQLTAAMTNTLNVYTFSLTFDWFQTV